MATTPPIKQALEAGDKDSLTGMLGALENFRAIRLTMPLQYVISFLLVASDEGKSVSDYAEKAGVSLSVMSRHLLDIGDRIRRP
jgi:hypothetical protein